MNSKYSEDEFLSWETVDAGVKSEIDLIDTQRHVQNGLRSLYATLKEMAKHDTDFDLGVSDLGDFTASGYKLPWSDEDGNCQTLELYKIDDKDQYIVNFSVTETTDRTVLMRSRRFVVDFREGVYFASISRPSEDIEEHVLWAELAEILDSTS